MLARDIGDSQAGEDVRVAPHELVSEGLRNVVDVPAFSCLLRHPGVQHNLEQDVAELLLQCLLVVADDRVVGLLEQVLRETRVGLLPPPRVAAGTDEHVDDLDDIEQPGAGRAAGVNQCLS